MLASLYDASVWTSLVAAMAAAIASILFLRTRNFVFDSLALAVTEIGVILLALGILTGAIAGKVSGGLWWTWDARLTTGLVCWLIYIPYLMLRNAIEEPTRRASSAAVVSILAFFDLPVAVLAVQWWLSRRSHAASGLTKAEWWEIALLIAITAVFTWIRWNAEQQRRARDAARREEQTI